MNKALLVVAGLALGISLGAAKWRGSAEQFHREARMAAILDQAAQMPAGGVVVIGDSTAEFNRFDSLCGLPALNAGIAWSTAGDWLGDDLRVIRAARPSLVILALGSNGDRDAYRQVAERTGARLAVPPRNKDMAAYIATVLPVTAPVLSYRDDKHPSAAGAGQWRDAINRACR